MVKYRSNPALMLTGTIFLILGITSLAISAFMASGRIYAKDTYAEISAVISDITYSSHKSPHYSVTVEYNYNGESFQSPLGYYISGMREGDTVEVLCDPDDPYKIISPSHTADIAIAVLGVVFAAIGAVFLLREYAAKKYILSLVYNDMYVYADYDREEASSLTVNKVRYRQSVFIYSGHDSEKYEFKSRPYAPRKESPYSGQKVKIYVDTEKNPAKYFIEENLD